MRKFLYEEYARELWDGEILGLVAQIHEHKGKQELFVKQKPEQLNKLVELAKIQSTEASNRIEGIVTTASRIGQLMCPKAIPRNRDEEEILGYRDVLNTIHENFEYIPVRPNYILQLHKDLYKYSNKSIGGRYKNSQNYIQETDASGNTFVRFQPLEPYLTEDAMNSLCEQYIRAIDNGETDPLLLIPVFILDFLCIHPFNDGNGRLSRLLTLLLLYQNGYVVGKYISIEKAIERTKNAYYTALGFSSQGWHENKNDVKPFMKYLLGILLSVYRDFEARVVITEERNLDTLGIVRLAVGNILGKFTKSKIMELCPTISRASVSNALNKLIEQGIITRNGSGKNTFYIKKN